MTTKFSQLNNEQVDHLCDIIAMEIDLCDKTKVQIASESSCGPSEYLSMIMKPEQRPKIARRAIDQLSAYFEIDLDKIFEETEFKSMKEKIAEHGKVAQEIRKKKKGKNIAAGREKKKQNKIHAGVKIPDEVATSPRKRESPRKKELPIYDSGNVSDEVKKPHYGFKAKVDDKEDSDSKSFADLEDSAKESKKDLNLKVNESSGKKENSDSDSKSFVEKQEEKFTEDFKKDEAETVLSSDRIDALRKFNKQDNSGKLDEPAKFHQPDVSQPSVKLEVTTMELSAHNNIVEKLRIETDNIIKAHKQEIADLKEELAKELENQKGEIKLKAERIISLTKTIDEQKETIDFLKGGNELLIEKNYLQSKAISNIREEYSNYREAVQNRDPKEPIESNSKTKPLISFNNNGKKFSFTVYRKNRFRRSAIKIIVSDE
jgi:hypothetical protein